MGRWPGDETDEEIEQLLEMTNDRKNIIQPTDWWAAWKAAADAEGKSLSEWIGERCNAGLQDNTQRTLSDRRRRGRPAKSGE